MSEADQFRKRLAAMMTEVGRTHTKPDGSDDYGYIVKWDSLRIEVAWYNNRELQDFALDCYPEDSWRPGKLGVSSAARDGVVDPDCLKDVKYALFFDIDYGYKEGIAIEAVRGLADTVEHAEDLIEWLDACELIPSDCALDYCEIDSLIKDIR